MPIDPSIALSGRTHQVNSPLDSFQKNIAIADMMARLQEQQSTAGLRSQEVKLREAEVSQAQRKINEENTFNAAIESHIKYDPEKKDIEYDDEGIAADLQKSGMAHLLPQFQEKRNTMRATARQRAIQEIEQTYKLTDALGVPAENFLATPEAERPAT